MSEPRRDLLLSLAAIGLSLWYVVHKSCSLCQARAKAMLTAWGL